MLGECLMEPSELFFGFCRYYSSLLITSDVAWSSRGQRTLAYFDSLGKMLGYNVNTEDTFTKSGSTDTAGDTWKCPPKLVGKRTDMTWSEHAGDQYVLAFEHQSSNNPVRIKRDIAKLAQYGSLKVLVVYGQDTEVVQQWIQKELQKTDDTEGTFLLVNVPYYFNKEPPLKLHARLLDKKGKIIAFGTAEARKEKIAGFNFFDNAQWTKGKISVISET